MDLRKLTSFMLVSACCLLSSWLAEARSVPLVNLEKQTWVLPEGKQLTLDHARQCIISGGARCKYPWMAQAGADGSLELMALGLERHQVKVRVTYTASEFSITYKGSVDLNYSKSASGEYIHPSYNTWIAELANIIKAEPLTLELLGSPETSETPARSTSDQPLPPSLSAHIKLDRAYILISGDDPSGSFPMELGAALVNDLKKKNIASDFHYVNKMDLDDEKIVDSEAKKISANYYIHVHLASCSYSYTVRGPGSIDHRTYEITINKIDNSTIVWTSPFTVSTSFTTKASKQLMELLKFYDLF